MSATGWARPLIRRTRRRSAKSTGGAFPYVQILRSSLLEKGGDEVLVEFPENARAMALSGLKISLEPFSSACLELLLFYKHPLNFQNGKGDGL
jgi:hypothetical protein